MRRHLLAEVVLTWLATVLLIRVVVQAFPPDVAWGLPLAMVPILFMWAPVWMLRWRGEDPDQYPLAIPAFDEPVWWPDFKLAATVSLVIFVPYLGLYHLWQTLWFPEVLAWGCDLDVPGACSESLRSRTFGPAWRFESADVAAVWLLQLVGYHVFFVAIPEELFYRGYVQSRLDEIWEPRWDVLGAKVGPGMLLACVIFAAGHSVVVFQWWHFAIVFPSLVFGWLRARTGGIMASAWFHAFANVLVAILDRVYGVAPS